MCALLATPLLGTGGRRLPPVYSSDSIHDTKKAKDHEGPEEADTGDVDDSAGSRSMLSDDEDESDGGGEE